MNRYFGPTVSWDRDPKERTMRPMDLPEFFKCPSDCTFSVPMTYSRNADIRDETAWTTWEFWGTSYPINWYWVYYYLGAEAGDCGGVV